VTNRKKLLFTMMVFSVFLLCSCSKAVNIENDNNTIEKGGILAKVFTVGNHNVSIMEIALPTEVAARINDITIKYKTNIEKNKEWFNDYISEHVNDEELPWDEKFGISKEEYDEMISSADKMTMVKKGSAVISIVKESDGKFMLESNEDLQYLSEIKIDTINNYLITEMGVFKHKGKIKASDDQKISGRWNGDSWILEFEEIKDINSIDSSKTYGTINIAVGQLEKTNQMIIYYKERVIYQGNSYKGEEIVVFDK